MISINKDFILDVAKDFEKISGRKYGLIEEYAMDDAEYAMVIQKFVRRFFAVRRHGSVFLAKHIYCIKRCKFSCCDPF